MIYSRCTKSDPPIWIGELEGIELNLPGNVAGPFTAALDYLDEIRPTFEIRLQKALGLLSDLTEFSDGWFADCLRIEVENGDFPSGFKIECSNEGDRYGLWWVQYQTIDLAETGSIGRIQT